MRFDNQSEKLMNLNHEYEIIISDDSTLFEISKSLKSLESISYVVGPKKSAVDNWNKLLDIANGDYVWCLHHDELITNNTIEMLNKINFDKYDAIILNLYIEIKDKIVQFRSNFFKKLIFYQKKITIYNNYLGSPSVLIHRKSDIRYNKKLKYLVDVDYFLKILSGKILFSNIPIISLQNKNSITSTYDTQSAYKKELTILNKNFTFYELILSLLNKIYNFYNYLKCYL